MRPRSLPPIIFLVVLILSLIIPTTSAANPLVQTAFTNYLAGTTTGSAAFSSNVVLGDVLVSVFAGAVAGNTCPTLGVPTDTRSNTFTAVLGPVCFTSGGATTFVQIYSTTTGTGGADTISETSSINAFSQFGIFELSSAVSLIGFVTGTGTGSATNTCATSSTSFTSISIAIAGCGQNVHNSVWGSADLTLLDLADLAYAGIGYSTTLGSPTQFHMGEAFGSNTFSDGGVIFGMANTGSQTLGSCPAKNTATFTMVNSTQYFYTQTLAASNEVLNTITAEVASVNSGHSASETLYFAIYSTASAGAISAGNPLLLVGFKTWTLSATSSPQNLVWSVGSAFNSPGGATVGIALIGNSKILINQSSLSGMFTGASAAVVGTTGTPNGQFTSLTSVGTELFFCGTLSFQTVVTTTTTVVGSSTTTITTTTTVTTASLQGVSNQLPYLLLDMLVILGPSLIIAELTRQMWGGILGAILGVSVAVLVGIAPFWLIIIVGLGCLTALLLSRGVKQGGGV